MLADFAVGLSKMNNNMNNNNKEISKIYDLKKLKIGIEKNQTNKEGIATVQVKLQIPILTSCIYINVIYSFNCTVCIVLMLNTVCCSCSFY